MKFKCYKIKRIHCQLCDLSFELVKTENLSVYCRKRLWFVVGNTLHAYGVGRNKKEALEDFQSMYCAMQQEEEDGSGNST